MCAANRKFIQADIITPDLHGKNTILKRSALKGHIYAVELLGLQIPFSVIGNVHFKPYLLKYCAFTLTISTMKTCSIAQRKANSILETLENNGDQNAKTD